MKKTILEVCVDSTESAVRAERGGADRLEMCGNLVIGGTTPSPALFRQIREKVSIPLRVLIRPRFGDFCYSDYELEVIGEEVRCFRDLGADAVVVGALRPDGSIDREAMERILDRAGHMEVTFHRAFDMCRDPRAELEVIKGLGIGTLLTSGQKNSALLGADLIRELMSLAGEKLVIMPGSGVSASTIGELDERLHARVYHMSGKKIRQSQMAFRQSHVSMGLKGLSEYEIWTTDEDEIRRAKEILSE